MSVQEVQMPTFTAPNLSAGAKAAEVFGNSNLANTQRAEANFKNQAEMYKWQMENQDTFKTNSLLKAGINPLIAYSQNSGIGGQTMGGSNGAQTIQPKTKSFGETFKELGELGSNVVKAIASFIGMIAG